MTTHKCQTNYHMATSTVITTLFTTCMLMISTVQASTPADIKTLNSSCIPIILRTTVCLDFLVTGSTVPTPSDQCCLRLKLTTEIDFPCLWDFFKHGKKWGHHKLNHTRAESLPLSCGIPFPFPPLKSGDSSGTSEVVQPAAPTPESPVPDQSGQVKTDLVDHDEHVEAPKSSAAMHKLPRLLLG